MLEWIFDPGPPSGAKTGGLAQAQVFETSSIDAFVREVLQNARDQRRGEDPVRVRFVLEDIDGNDYESFLEGATGSMALLDHLYAAVSGEFVTISPRIASSLDAMLANGCLRLLRIDDYGTHGLLGGEDDSKSNF